MLTEMELLSIPQNLFTVRAEVQRFFLDQVVQLEDNFLILRRDDEARVVKNMAVHGLKEKIQTAFKQGGALRHRTKD